ncbi:hypothetical protein KDA_36100 [Dictyobacter alpinus]|uniref:Uncharacterized protein n=1 Tax=Dictyobacter alpinus TaxID=2014873 RepID=A0A402B9X3_9CHLR|nr:hypothetical protein KDA_36100 [Dictyobacter alpinus]
MSRQALINDSRRLSPAKLQRYAVSQEVYNVMKKPCGLDLINPGLRDRSRLRSTALS